MTQQDYNTSPDSVKQQKSFTNKSKFQKKPCRWQDKNQILPNALPFAELTDAAVRLLLVLNALPESWEIVQEDIRLRLGWGEEKMCNAIKNCVQHGYMRTFKPRSSNGRFENVDIEFDVYPTFLKEKVPDRGDPGLETSGSDLSREPIEKEEKFQSYRSVLDNKNVRDVSPKGDEESQGEVLPDKTADPCEIPQPLQDMEAFGLEPKEQLKLAKIKCSEFSLRRACEDAIKYIQTGEPIKNLAAFLTKAIRDIECITQNGLPYSDVWKLRKKHKTG